MSPDPTHLAFIGLLVLAACQVPPSPGVAHRIDKRAQTGTEARPGACYGKDVIPAVVETLTEQVLVAPATRDVSGKRLTQAIFKTSTHQKIVRKRRTVWFQTPCAAQLPPEFISSLQRALAARGLYHGAISGVMDAPTRRAVRRYQAPRGRNSSLLSIGSARALGLVVIAPPPAAIAPIERNMKKP